MSHALCSMIDQMNLTLSCLSQITEVRSTSSEETGLKSHVLVMKACREQISSLSLGNSCAVHHGCFNPSSGGKILAPLIGCSDIPVEELSSDSLRGIWES